MDRLKKMMMGRYGVDQLSNFMITISIIIIIASSIWKIPFLNILSTAILIISYARVFSRNINKRYQENAKFLNYWNPIKYKYINLLNRIKSIRTHKYLKCPNCKQKLRVPRGKGKININCSKCHNKFEARS